MTDTERNELVEKLTNYLDTGSELSRAMAKLDAPRVVRAIESLGYEIVKNEHWKEATDAWVLQ